MRHAPLDTLARLFGIFVLVGGLFAPTSLAQTDGECRLEVTLLDYNGSGTKHYTVVWVTTGSGTFIKTLRKQGPSKWSSSEWNSHCQAWNNARAGSQLLDGYTSATASNYSGTNSPVICTWNVRGADNQLVPDGTYKFWVQYAENSGQGPYTTSGLSWTKGPDAATKTYASQGANFAGMRVSWVPSPPPPVPPTITSVAPTPTGTVGVPYRFLCTATGTAPIAFTAQGLPAGLTLDAAGQISGTPTTPGTFDGTLSARNGTAPDATQPFSIVIVAVPTRLSSVRLEGSQVLLGGQGPAGGTCAVLTSPDPTLGLAEWTTLAPGTFDDQGTFSLSHPLDPTLGRLFYRLRVP